MNYQLHLPPQKCFPPQPPLTSTFTTHLYIPISLPSSYRVNATSYILTRDLVKVEVKEEVGNHPTSPFFSFFTPATTFLDIVSIYFPLQHFLFRLDMLSCSWGEGTFSQSVTSSFACTDIGYHTKIGQGVGERALICYYTTNAFFLTTWLLATSRTVYRTV